MDLTPTPIQTTNPKKTTQRVKEIRRETDPASFIFRLEDHHITPRFLGGNGDMENNFALTLPEHAIVHWIEAVKAPNQDQAAGHLWSVNQIIGRMSPGEFVTFNKMFVDVQRRH